MTTHQHTLELCGTYVFGVTLAEEKLEKEFLAQHRWKGKIPTTFRKRMQSSELNRRDTESSQKLKPQRHRLVLPSFSNGNVSKYVLGVINNLAGQWREAGVGGIQWFLYTGYT